ncbi:dna polymerase delta subunit 4 [Curvularia clavata]|uniref:Dna polymerase delta subunit 4 n=1 Tax=Curvularia clavata TaxID=95742 RepID=A0A9Q8Z8V4_CURCL|nr:dna polymerase delta subunit 4 [Curvularia clavata]
MALKSRNTRSATKSHQSTLAFHGTSNKVTKSGVKAQAVKKSNLEKKLKDATPEILGLTVAEPTTTEAAIIDQTEQEIQAQQVESSPEEEQARRISDAAIKKYWAAKEKQREAPRVHQQGLSLEDKILREFDMSAHYGPCTGIARLKRWKRAQRLGLEPPVEVLAVLLKAQDAKERDKISVQRSIMDEMLNAKAELDV